MKHNKIQNLSHLESLTVSYLASRSFKKLDASCLLLLKLYKEPSTVLRNEERLDN